ncbi:MAG: prenyltransferase/squalene oxidase repeat-containing protein [Opitutia bacterium]
MSCHQVPSMLRCMEAAATRGFKVPRAYMDETTEWSSHWENWINQGAKGGKAGADASNVDTMSALLLMKQGAADAEWGRQFRKTLLSLQQPDGSWKPGGQLPQQNRPPREQKEVSTLWVLLTLRSDPAAGAAVTKARAFLAAAPKATSVERLVLELVLSAEQREAKDAAVARLLATQSKDGGWPWKIGGPSDAFGTGMALHALSAAGLPREHPAVSSALRFLTSTQRPDGSWAVPSTRTKDAGKIKPTSTDWGTAWAVIGMTAYLPAKSGR